jgi:hypothetical protein
MFSPWRRLAQYIRLAVSGHRVENLPLDRRSIEVLVRVAQLKRNPFCVPEWTSHCITERQFHEKG